MKQRKYRIFSCDFETTVYDNQDFTEVWASACVEMYTEDVFIGHSLQELFDYFNEYGENIMAYFHNLKFDGSFWLPFLMQELHYKQAYKQIGKESNQIAWLPEKDMLNNTFKYSISDKGQWYSITIKSHNHIIEIRDSLKLLPFSVKQIGDAFKTKHRKLNMEYKGYRYAGCVITEEEKTYIANDVLVVKEALEKMFEEGHTKITIGSCCMSEFKKICKTSTNMPMEYDEMFPNQYAITLNPEEYNGDENVGQFVRKSYKGAWCYVVEGKENEVHTNGLTLDVNSLYPSMMHSQSGNYYPIGNPIFWKGNFIPEEATKNHHYFFIRIKCHFHIKKGKLPFIQIKNSLLYKSTETLKTSYVYDKKHNEYYKHIPVILTLTMSDYYLILEHYDLEEFEILSGCWYYTEIGIFDEYINKYMEIKQNSSGAIRTIAKLFLNNLYGKLASSMDSSFKFAVEKEDGVLRFEPIEEEKKAPGYIPCGSAIISYARCFTISKAQQNYYGANKRGFIYADTDSLHCDLPLKDINGVTLHPTKMSCFKHETSWDRAIFVRAKTYIEHVVEEDGEQIDSPYYNITCAGMPDKCKNLLRMSLNGEVKERDIDGNEIEYTKEEQTFLFDENFDVIKRDITDFKVGIEVPGKLLPKRIKGGIVLEDGYFTMH